MKASPLEVLGLLIVFLFFINDGLKNTASAKETNTKHTYRLGEHASPPASLDDAAMLIGSWSGEAFGSRFEETWNPPSAGSMVGMFKVFDEKKGVSFYELMLLAEENQSLVLKVKHFSADFKGWEGVDKFVSFPLVSIEENVLHFSGLSFYKQDQNTLDAYVAIKTEEGLREEKLAYRRVVSDSR